MALSGKELAQLRHDAGIQVNEIFSFPDDGRSQRETTAKDIAMQVTQMITAKIGPSSRENLNTPGRADEAREMAKNILGEVNQRVERMITTELDVQDHSDRPDTRF